jgi:hypothetical protein
VLATSDHPSRVQSALSVILGSLEAQVMEVLWTRGECRVREVDQGILDVTVCHLERGEIYEVDTPNFAFTVMKPGVYRFDVYPNEDSSWVTVHSGYSEATGKGIAVRVNSGQGRFKP